MTNDEIMTAEEFFGEVDVEETRSSRPSRPRGRKPEKSRVYDIKVKMVMRVYGVSRERAVKLIEEHGEASSRPASGNGCHAAAKPRDIEEALDDIFAD